VAVSEWEPATEAEIAMREALRVNDQEQYFRILARGEVLLPVAADALGATGEPGWGTWTTEGRTHVLAFTSAQAFEVCLAGNAGSYRRLQFHELAMTWPNVEWWLAVNPGLPIEGYLPSWFVTQISRGDVRLPGRTLGARARMDQASAMRARAVAQIPLRNVPTQPPQSTIDRARSNPRNPAVQPAPTALANTPTSPASGVAGVASPSNGAAAARPQRPGDALPTRVPGATTARGPASSPSSGAPFNAPSSPGAGFDSPSAGGRFGASPASGAPFNSPASPGFGPPSGGVPSAPSSGSGFGAGFGAPVRSAGVRPEVPAGVVRPEVPAPAPARPEVPLGVNRPGGSAAPPANGQRSDGPGSLPRRTPGQSQVNAATSGPSFAGAAPSAEAAAPPAPQPEVPFRERRFSHEPPAGGYFPASTQAEQDAQDAARAFFGEPSQFAPAHQPEEPYGEGFFTDTRATPEPAPRQERDPYTPSEPVSRGERDSFRDRRTTPEPAPRQEREFFPDVEPPQDRELFSHLPQRGESRGAPDDGNDPSGWPRRQPGRSLGELLNAPPVEHAAPAMPAAWQPPPAPEPPQPPSGYAPAAPAPAPVPAAGWTQASETTWNSTSDPLPRRSPQAAPPPVAEGEIVEPEIVEADYDSRYAPGRFDGFAASEPEYVEAEVIESEIIPPAAGRARLSEPVVDAEVVPDPVYDRYEAYSTSPAPAYAEPPSTPTYAPEPPSAPSYAPQPQPEPQPEPSYVPEPSPRRVFGDPNANTQDVTPLRPANDVEQSLLDAAEEGSTDRFLSTLLLAKVIVPGWDGESTVDPAGWGTEDLPGGRHLIVFTSQERMTERLGVDVGGGWIKFTRLIRSWPGPSLAFAVNPDTKIGATLPGDEVVQLASWAAEQGLGADEPEGAPTSPPPPVTEQPASRPNFEPATSDGPVMMQKPISPEQLSYYLERGYDRVSGFVHRSGEVAHLKTPEQLYQALGLGYAGSAFRPDAAQAFVLRWLAYRANLYRIPYGGQHEAGMRAMEGWVIERPPFRGNGFAPSETNDVIAEFKVDSARLPHNAQLWRLRKDGEEELIALLDADGPRWRPVGES
jgi:hypothetical protein